jgi:glycosyltransferase involved in cell wall biosynthesis
VTSAQGGPVEVVEGQGTGYCVPVGDIDGYASALVSLLTDENRRKAAGAASLRLMRERYRWSRVADRILTLIEAARQAPRGTAQAGPSKQA